MVLYTLPKGHSKIQGSSTREDLKAQMGKVLHHKTMMTSLNGGPKPCYDYQLSFTKTTYMGKYTISNDWGWITINWLRMSGEDVC